MTDPDSVIDSGAVQGLYVCVWFERLVGESWPGGPRHFALGAAGA